MKKRIHKKPPRRLKSKKKSYQKLVTIIATIAVTIMLATVVGAYFFIDKKEITVDIQQEQQKNRDDQKKKLITFEEKTKALEIEYSNNIDNSTYIEDKEKKTQTPKFHYEEPDYGKVDDIIEPQKEQLEQKKDTVQIYKPTQEDTSILTEKKVYKPKLAIIIDDVTTLRQIEKILNLGYTVNMAFLPPTSGHKNSAKITRKLDNYMIHLPLQASSFKYEEEHTLYITDSLDTIENRIVSLIKLYPKAKFLNNHTGSKFTANQEAMDKLFQVLKKYDFTFVDSRTTSKSVAAKSAKKYGVRMLSRNIFLDNNKNKKYIQGQLKKAIKTAIKNGSAIAIGHPYSITFEALRDSKHLLKDLDLVYIHQL